MHQVCMVLAPPVLGALMEPDMSGNACEPVAGGPAHHGGKGVYRRHGAQFPRPASGVS